nr:hypothetical protein Iba_chr11fCG3060 [Ipomoea batatas]
MIEVLLARDEDFDDGRETAALTAAAISVINGEEKQYSKEIKRQMATPCQMLLWREDRSKDRRCIPRLLADERKKQLYTMTPGQKSRRKEHFAALTHISIKTLHFENPLEPPPFTEGLVMVCELILAVLKSLRNSDKLIFPSLSMSASSRSGSMEPFKPEPWEVKSNKHNRLNAVQNEASLVGMIFMKVVKEIPGTYDAIDASNPSISSIITLDLVTIFSVFPH